MLTYESLADWLIVEVEGGDKVSVDAYGGRTRWGISSKWWPGVDLDKMDLPGARVFYRKNFWKPLGLDKLSLSAENPWHEKIAKNLFAFAVNTNPPRSAKALQLTLNMVGWEQPPLAVDGRIGPATAGRFLGLSKAGYSDVIHRALEARIKLHYFEQWNDPNQKPYFRGWMRRVVP